MYILVSGRSESVREKPRLGDVGGLKVAATETVPC